MNSLHEVLLHSPMARLLAATAKYFYPMCPGVDWNQSGDYHSAAWISATGGCKIIPAGTFNFLSILDLKSALLFENRYRYLSARASSQESF